MLPIHVCVMALIIVISHVITPEPYSINQSEIDGSFIMDEKIGDAQEDTYILDKGDHYNLYVYGEYTCSFHEIIDDFKEYPVYKEKPGDAEYEMICYTKVYSVAFRQ